MGRRLGEETRSSGLATGRRLMRTVTRELIVRRSVARRALDPARRARSCMRRLKLLVQLLIGLPTLTRRSARARLA